MSAGSGLSEAVSPADAVSSGVTALFVPGDRPERFEKAAAAGPDTVIIDLEDAVAPAAKAAALAAVVTALKPGTSFRALVRVNAADSRYYSDDIDQLLGLAQVPGHGLLGLMLPKAEDAAVIEDLAGRLQTTSRLSLAVGPLVESALGVMNSLGIAGVPGVTRLAFGAIDYALDINASGDDRFLDYARATLVNASRAAGIAAPLDSPSTDIKDTANVAKSARLARDFGFAGKLCIHPAQVQVVKDEFIPNYVEVAWARSVLAAEGGAAQVDGQMVDRPVTERAHRILQRAGHTR